MNYTIKLVIAIFIGIGLNSCTEKVENPVFWVNSFKSECDMGAGKSTCITVSKNASLDSLNWQVFSNQIKGFDFELGFLQKIELKVEKLDNNSTTQDASTLKYTLVKVLDKIKDNKYLINDIWAAYRIEGKLLQNLSDIPTLEVNLSKMQIFGNNGCNEYSGKLNGISDKRINFGEISSTKKLCFDMETPSIFDFALNSSTRYKLDEKRLYLLDKYGNETIAFKKAD